MDPIFASFLEEQEREALELSSASDLVEIEPVGEKPRQHFHVRYLCRGLVDTPQGVAEAGHFEMGVFFPLHYWQRANPAEVLTWLGPVNTFHPNVIGFFVCPGRLTPGTSLVDLVLQCYEIVTWQKVTMREDDALNRKACEWARKHLDRLPIDDRPIRSRRLDYRVRDAVPEGGA